MSEFSFPLPTFDASPLANVVETTYARTQPDNTLHLAKSENGLVFLAKEWSSPGRIADLKRVVGVGDSGCALVQTDDPDDGKKPRYLLSNGVLFDLAQTLHPGSKEVVAVSLSNHPTVGKDGLSVTLGHTAYTRPDGTPVKYTRVLYSDGTATSRPPTAQEPIHANPFASVNAALRGKFPDLDDRLGKIDPGLAYRELNFQR